MLMDDPLDVTLQRPHHLQNIDSSTEAWEHRDPATEASETLTTERSFSVHVRTMCVEVSSALDLSLPTREALIDAEVAG